MTLRQGQEKNEKIFRRKYFLFSKFVIQYYSSAGYGAVGSALRSGRRGRQFESDYSDQIKEVRCASLFFYGESKIHVRIGNNLTRYIDTFLISLYNIANKLYLLI